MGKVVNISKSNYESPIKYDLELRAIRFAEREFLKIKNREETKQQLKKAKKVLVLRMKSRVYSPAQFKKFHLTIK